MRVRARKENPKSRQSSLNYERKRVLQGALLFEKYRDIDGFLASLKERLKDRGLSVKQIQINLGFNKKVIYSWLRDEKIPSQKYQVAVCEYLDIPYHKLALTPNEQGDYPCGIRACNVCGCEFALFKKINYGQMKCCSCRQLNSSSK